MSPAISELSLDERIAAAFGNGAKSADVAALIKEAKAASLLCNDTAERARKRALDPVLSVNDVADARRQMEDAAFRCDRLQAALTRLRERLEEVKAQEEDQQRQLVYERVKAERDKLAAELAEIYPPFAHKLAELLPRIVANDREIEYINNHARPSGADRLLVAELIARNLEGFGKSLGSIVIRTPRITEELCLPTFKYSAHHPYVWPGSR
jgi:hypothetical protein